MTAMGPQGKVLVTPRSLQPREGRHHEALEPLLARGLQIVYPEGQGPFPSDRLRPLVRGVSAAIIGLDHFDAAVVEAADSLRVVARYGVGYDRVDVRACTARGIVVTNTPDANTVAVAEHAIALMFGVARRLVEHHTGVLQGRWRPQPGIELAGRRLGLVGLGRIGLEVGRRCRALGMTVAYYDVVRKPELEATEGFRFLDFPELLSWADIVSLHAPYTPGSPPLIGAEELGRMSPGALLINTARGELVDEEALCQALQSGRLGGAGLDVFRQEPLPPSHPLLRLPNVLLSPHAAAQTRDAVRRMAESAVESVLDVLEGRRPRHVVNPEVYEGGRGGGAP